MKARPLPSLFFLLLCYSLCGLGLAGCAASDGDAAAQKQAFYQAVRQQVAHSQHESYTVAPLLSVLSDSLAAFRLAETDTLVYAHSRGTFGQVRRIFLQAEDAYLAWELTDYGQDSLALFRLYEQLAASVPDHAESPHAQADAWQLSVVPAAGNTQLDLLVSARYLLSVQTNMPEGASLLPQLVAELRLDALPH